MENATQTTTNAEWQEILSRRAQAITTVRNDIFTLNKWQLVLNALLGLVAAGGLIASMFISGVARTVLTIVSIVLIIIFVVYNFALKTFSPTSILQYTCVDRGKTYRFQVLSKKRSAYSDGENCIIAERGDVSRVKSLIGDVYRYDYFARMTASSRTKENGLDIFAGELEANGKRYKCKIAFNGEIPVFGNVGGARIKYFDVNNPKEKFIVPTELKNAAKSADIPFPKLPGLHVRDDKSNFNNR